MWVVRGGQQNIPGSFSRRKRLFSSGAAKMYTVACIHASCLGGSHLQLQLVPSLQHLDQALLHLLPVLHLEQHVS